MYKYSTVYLLFVIHAMYYYYHYYYYITVVVFFFCFCVNIVLAIYLLFLELTIV